MKKKQLLSIFAALTLAAHPISAATHIAQKGDTFWLIAQKYGVSLSALLSANNADESTVLNIGDTVVIPSSSSVHIAQKGDTFWLISQKYGVSLSALLSANNANESTVLNIGDAVVIPSSSSVHIAQKGDTFWLISQKYGVSLSALLAANNANESTVLNIGDAVTIPSSASTGGSAATSTPSTGDSPYITYKSYTVKANDTLWNIAIENGIPFTELLEANGLNENSIVNVGKVLTIPVHHIPVKSTVSSSHGELLDWWSEAQYVVPINAVFTVYDINTGKSFQAKRTVGANHADCEPLTAADTAMMTELWGSTSSWNKRPVLIKINGRQIAASAAGALHAGNEWAAGGVWTDWRSGDYGAGINYDYVKGNNASGHFDIHFYNSLKHNDGKVDTAHQANIKIAAGIG